MQASLNNSEQEINDCINNVEFEISDFQAQKEEADNFYEILKKVTALSNEVDFGTGSKYGAPDVMFSDISVSGK